jgi:hypothetical protein
MKMDPVASELPNSDSGIAQVGRFSKESRSRKASLPIAGGAYSRNRPSFTPSEGLPDFSMRATLPQAFLADT